MPTTGAGPATDLSKPLGYAVAQLPAVDDPQHAGSCCTARRSGANKRRNRGRHDRRGWKCRTGTLMRLFVIPSVCPYYCTTAIGNDLQTWLANLWRPSFSAAVFFARVALASGFAMCASRPVATTLAPPPQPGSTPTSPPSSPPSLRHQSRAQFHARRCSPTPQVNLPDYPCLLGTLLLWYTHAPADRAPRGGAAAPLAALRGGGRARRCRTQQCSTRRGVGSETRRKAPPCWCPAGHPGRLGRALPGPDGSMHSGSTRTTHSTPPLLRPQECQLCPRSSSVSHLSASASQRTPRWGWRCASGTRCCATSARRFRRGAPSKSPSSPSSWRRSSAQTHVENNAGQRSPSCLAEAGSSSGQPKA